MEARRAAEESARPKKILGREFRYAGAGDLTRERGVGSGGSSHIQRWIDGTGRSFQIVHWRPNEGDMQRHQRILISYSIETKLEGLPAVSAFRILRGLVLDQRTLDLLMPRRRWREEANELMRFILSTADAGYPQTQVDVSLGIANGALVFAVRIDEPYNRLGALLRVEPDVIARYAEALAAKAIPGFTPLIQPVGVI